MKKEDKQLLLQNLCAMLPYDVCVHIKYKTGEPCYGKLTPRDIQWFIDSKIENIKPYLRPMSSMTVEEQKEWFEQGNVDYDCEFKPEPTVAVEFSHLSVDWLNAHHFDYRGLIEKGLALEALDGMYKID